MKFVGAHVSASGGVENAPVNANNIGAKAFAFLNKRAYVIPEDVKENAGMVLAHRLILSSYARGQGSNAYEALQVMISTVEPPRMDD